MDNDVMPSLGHAPRCQHYRHTPECVGCVRAQTERETVVAIVAWVRSAQAHIKASGTDASEHERRVAVRTLHEVVVGLETGERRKR